MQRQKRSNKINNFNKKTIKIHKSHSEKPSDNNINNITAQLSSSESPSYYYHYSKTNEFNQPANQVHLQQPPPSYYFNKNTNQVNTSMSDYFEPLKDVEYNSIVSNNKNQAPNLIPEQRNDSKRTATFSRSSLSLNLTHNHNKFEQRTNETDDDEPVIIRASDDEPDQLIVEELKESPKSIYSRYFSNKQSRVNLTEKENSYSPINIIDIDQSPKTSRLNYLLYSRQSLQEKPKSSNEMKETGSINSSLSETNNTSSDSYERFSTNDVSSTSISSLNEITNYNKSGLFRAKKKILNQPKRFKRMKKNLSAIGSVSSQNHFENSKSSNLKLHSSPTNKSRSSGVGSNIRLIALHKNKISSDIEIEDDLIFNDDTDSLSSAGVICSPASSLKNNNGSQKTLVNANKSISDNEQLLNNRVDLLKTSYSADNQIKIVKLNASSISDIDPDDNILNSLLVKQTFNKEYS